MSQTVRNNFIRELPKLELHCHLDGSLTQKSIEEIMEKTGGIVRTSGGAGLPQSGRVSAEI